MFKRDLVFSTPLFNAAGMLGFAPNPRGPVDLSQMGAFVTNPISLKPRTPAEKRRLAPYPGGFLLHTGLPNPGFRSVLKQYAARWEAFALPVIVHVMPVSPGELSEMAHRLEGIENILGIEVGLHPQVTAQQARDILAAGAGELPLIACLPMESLPALMQVMPSTGVSAISLSAPRGTLMLDGELISGRLYGPGVLPAALAAVQAAAQTGIPVIGGGGVYRAQDAAAMQTAGAFAVQIDAALWLGQEKLLAD